MEPGDADHSPLPDDDYRPWEEVGAVRRDSEPHRGSLIQMLGIVALVGGIASLPTCFCFCFAPVSVAALVLGSIVWVMGQGDLNRMEAGTMDPRGREQTRLGLNLGRAATILAIVSVVLTVAVWILALALQMSGANPPW